MMKAKLSRFTFAALLTIVVFATFIIDASAQRRRSPKHASICGNPNVTCRTSVTFEPHNLPFRVPANAAIYDTELFYAVILKSMRVKNDDCKVFVSEAERLPAQALFPDHKVFASRCYDPGEFFYSNINQNSRIMAVYAGPTLADANKMLAAVKETGKFAGAYIRRMRTGFNGT